MIIPLQMKPLFIALKREYFEAFECGEKPEEYRPYGSRWNERTCPLGRPVTLSLGYGKNRRLKGMVVSFRKDGNPHELKGWAACYGDKYPVAACIGIKVNGRTA